MQSERPIVKIMPARNTEGSLARILALLVAILALAFAAGNARAQDTAGTTPLEVRATEEIRDALFPDADRFEPSDGTPPYLRAYVGDVQLGYIFSTLDVVRARSYSSLPFDAIVGMDLSGKLTGIRLIRHHDPYLTGFPARMERLNAFFDAHIGHDVVAAGPAPMAPNFVQGTTISARNMRAGVIEAGRLIMRVNDPRPPVTEPTIDRLGYTFMEWEQLLAIGAVSDRTITVGEIRADLDAAGIVPVQMDVPMARSAPDDVFTELVVALATPSLVGRNILTGDSYSNVVERAPDDVVLLAVMSGGRYDFRGRQYQSAEFGNTFDRIRLTQGDLQLEFHADDFDRASSTVQRFGGPFLRHAGLFTIPLSTGFDPLAPFDVILMVHATDAAGVRHTLEYPVRYQVPSEAILLPPVEPPPPWAEAWHEARVDLVILGIALTVLTLIFAFQARLARNRKLHQWLRPAFLVFTLVWLGWIAGGQLSIVHVVNYIKAPFDGADLGYYLAEPLILVIALYVLLSLIVIGRGVFCGWLCPFGALQELTARVARWLRLPVWNPSERVQRWMWVPKYAIAGVIVFTAFALPEALATVEEVEPFKTAITSAFTRPWPYVTYAVVLVMLSLFTERFFCRFLCPLGGVLALGDRLHLFTFLKRRPECGGGGCHLCERSCPVKAIERSGKIVMAECFQCLDCQVEYYDDRRCPPLARARKQRERLAAAASRPAVAAE